MKCPICHHGEITSEAGISMQACDGCASIYGIRPMPPVTRPATPCPKCGGRKFVHAVPREHSTFEGDERTQRIAVPMKVTFPPKRITGPYGLDIPIVDAGAGHGLLEIYLCFGCGAVEWYCNEVDRIPLHPHLMTELVDFDAGGPYR